MNYNEEIEQRIENILTKTLTEHSIDTLNLVKKYIDICISRCRNAKFGRKKGEYEAYKNVQIMLDKVISELEMSVAQECIDIIDKEITELKGE